MRFDFERMQGAECFEFLTSTVVPRPIALITTLAEDGRPNAAPYSFFSIMGCDPPVLAVGLLPCADGTLKDTAANILRTGEFVAHLVPETLAEAMNVTCIDAPTGVNELELARLETVSSEKVKPPRVVGSPIAFECRTHAAVSLGPGQLMVIGRIVQAHVDDLFVLDADRPLIDTSKLKLIGSMHGAKWYARTSDLLQMERPSWANWLRETKV